MTRPVLRLKDFGLGFATPEGFLQVLHDVDIVVNEGEIVGLIGESGSGKTVTAKYVLGILPERGTRVTSGSAELMGRNLLTQSPRERNQIKRYIAYVPQDPMAALNPSFTIATQMCDVIIWNKSEQSLKRYLWLRRSRRLVAEARERAASLLDKVAIRDVRRVLDSYPVELSGGMRQRVLLALAMSGEPKLLVADEPTTALDVTVQKRIVDLIQELVEREKLSGLYITHDLGVARWLCQRSYVMLRGRVVESNDTRSLLDAPRHEYTRRLVAAVPRLHDDVPERVLDGTCGVGSAVVLKAENLTKTFGGKVAVKDVNFSVRKGETFAIVGESGSGKTTIAHLLCGLKRPTLGSFTVGFADRDAERTPTGRVAASKIQMVFQDPGSSLNPRQTVENIIGLPLQLRGLAGRQARRERVAELLEKVALPRRTMRQLPRSLSGGEKQRVSIARALATEPAILVLDEPTSALDVSVQARILDLLRDLQEREALTYVLISHDLGVVRSIADRVAVLYQGQIVEQGKTADILLNPQHEYTRELIAAVPAIDAGDGRPS